MPLCKWAWPKLKGLRKIIINSTMPSEKLKREKKKEVEMPALPGCDE